MLGGMKGKVMDKEKQRYSVYGSEVFEAKVQADMDIVSKAVVDGLGSEAVVSIILMGGYGRGEGAVLMRDDKEYVFNDYDFFIITCLMSVSAEARRQEMLKNLSLKLTKDVGIEVDLYMMSKEKFSKSPFNLMNYEARVISRIIYGDKDILECMPEYDVNHIPLSEGPRLLLNRGKLLMWCKEQLCDQRSMTVNKVEKIIKFFFKAALAMGDSYLLMMKNYHYSYIVKAKRFEGIDSSEFEFFEDLKGFYLEAIEFKLIVDYEKYEERDLKIWFEDVVRVYEGYWKWYEGRRLDCVIEEWQGYQKEMVRISWRQGPKRIAKNIFINIREFGVFEVFRNPDLLACYVRQRLYMLMPFMLFVPSHSISKAARLISSKADDAESLNNDFLNLWKKYS